MPEVPVTNLNPIYTDTSVLKDKCILVHDKTTGDPIRFDASKLSTTAKDLSMFTPDGASLVLRETANCYVVRTPGVYKFPCVYGNGIKNGVANVAAYTNIGGSNCADFVNHLGNVITSPFIEKNANCQPASAQLIWQTGAHLITAISLIEEGECKFLHFTVGEVPATNGVALLAVKNSAGDVMWSWMIWLTSDTLGPEAFTNYTSVKYNLMSEALGAIWNTDRTRAYNPHFQWGRKDPMAPLNGSGSQCTLYDINGNVYSGYGTLGSDCDQSAEKTVANAIKQPNKFFIRYDDTSHNWNNLTRFNNFWNAALNVDSLADDQETAIKTIYDPCPVGWMLPSGRAFTGFTSTGRNSEDSTTFRVVGAFANGWKFKKNVDDVVGSYFPASGCRDLASGGLYRVGSSGYYWSYASYSQAGARNLYFGSGGVYPLYNDYRASGFSVRPCRELD